MQVVKQYPDGIFSWVDLGTTDIEAAKVFYGGLFGWSFLDIPTDSGTIYSMAQIEGYDVAGLGPLNPAMQEQGVPTHWSAYVKHDDVDAVAEKMYGKTSMGIERSTFLIDAEGKIARIWRKVKVAGHVEDVLEAVKALQA